MSQQQTSPIVVIFGSSSDLVSDVDRAFAAPLAPVLGYPGPWFTWYLRDEPWWVNPLADEALQELLRLRPDLARDSVESWVETEEFVGFVRQHLLEFFTESLKSIGYDQIQSWRRHVRVVVLAEAFEQITPYVERVLTGFFPNAKAIGDPADGPGQEEALKVGMFYHDGRMLSEVDIQDLEEFRLGTRTHNCLKRAGINNLAELVSKTEEELEAIPNFGRRAVDEVVEVLGAQGFELSKG